MIRHLLLAATVGLVLAGCAGAQRAAGEEGPDEVGLSH